MSYSVTVMNDSKILDNSNGGIIHSWLKFNDGSADADYFGFTPKNGWFDDNIRGKDTEGFVEDRKALKNRPPTETKTFSLTETQYRQMMQGIKQFKERLPGYDLTPDGDGDANCTTAANQILQSAGIDYLEGLQTPFGVADRNAINSP